MDEDGGWCGPLGRPRGVGREGGGGGRNGGGSKGPVFKIKASSRREKKREGKRNG